jgi:hypothetical protein
VTLQVKENVYVYVRQRPPADGGGIMDSADV